MKPLKNKVSITLDADIIDKIKELAEEDDRSFSQYINLVLREHIKNLDKSELLLNRPIIMAIYSRNLYRISG